jgi:hypothetical protein
MMYKILLVVILHFYVQMSCDQLQIHSGLFFCSSHTFPSEGSPNHQPGSKDDCKNVDSKPSSGGDGKTVRIAPEPPQTCGMSNKCADEDRSSSDSGLKDGAGCRYSHILNNTLYFSPQL